MSINSTMSELEVLDYIYTTNSSLEYYEQERCKNFYHCFKFHLPSEMFKDGNLKFSYNKGLTYISAVYNDLVLFKIPNSTEEKIEALFPADKEFIKSLNIPDNKKSSLVKKLKNHRKSYITIDVESEAILSLSLEHWTQIQNLYNELLVK